MKIPQDNHPPDRFEPSNTVCLQLDDDVRYFSAEYTYLLTYLLHGAESFLRS